MRVHLALLIPGNEALPGSTNDGQGGSRGVDVKQENMHTLQQSVNILLQVVNV